MNSLQAPRPWAEHGQEMGRLALTDGGRKWLQRRDAWLRKYGRSNEMSRLVETDRDRKHRCRS